jgi:two-component system, OmpR family, KDP operon response regulator KdpE
MSCDLKPTVLVVDDDLPIRRYLHGWLSDAGYRVEDASSGEEALKLAARIPPDAVILDLGLPDIDGQEVLIQLREWLKAPVIVLSGRGQEAQKITAFDHGADDYLTKPFSTGELLARMRAVLRRGQAAQNGVESPVLECGDIRVDLSARRVTVKNAEVHMTPIEYALLVMLMRHVGKVLPHRFLLEAVWGSKQVHETQYLRVFMAGLRKKIEDDPANPRYLITEQGVGYRLIAGESYAESAVKVGARKDS